MDTNLRKQDFSLFCRFCIRGIMNKSQDSIKLHSLFDYPERNAALNIAEIFMATTPHMSISSTDKLPQIICNTCLNKLLDVQKFHQLCKESEQSLLLMLKQSECQVQTTDSQDKNLIGTNASMIIDSSIVKEELSIEEDHEYLNDTRTNDFRAVNKTMKTETNATNAGTTMDFQPEFCIDQITEDAQINQTANLNPINDLNLNQNTMKTHLITMEQKIDDLEKKLKIMNANLVKIGGMVPRILAVVNKMRTNVTGPPLFEFPLKTTQELDAIDAEIATDQNKYIELLKNIIMPEGIVKNLHRIFSKELVMSMNYDGKCSKQNLSEYNNLNEALFESQRRNGYSFSDYKKEVRLAYTKAKILSSLFD